MLITRINPISKKEVTRDIPVTLKQLQEWEHGGKPIQKVMSNLSDTDREFIMTGLSDADWDSMFESAKEEKTLQDNLNHLTDWFITGSRAMSLKDDRVVIKKDTDIDIMAPYNEHNMQFIEEQADWYCKKEQTNIQFNNVLQAEDDDYHFDDTTVAIGKFNEVVVNGKSYEMQITLRTEYEMVKDIWANMDIDFYYYSLWKRGPILSHSDYHREAIRANLNQLYKIYRGRNGLSGMVM